MLTVYIGESPVCFTDEPHPIPKAQGVMYTSYSCPETMKLFVDMLEKNKEVKTLIVRHSDPVTAFTEFCSCFHLIEAAGGLVINRKGQILFIFRNGKWDLPKGKMEKKEDAETAAVREVTEECGIGGLKIIRPLPSTFHTYLNESERILKRTYWYEMRTESDVPLVPQTDEGITQAKWMGKDEADKALLNTFPSVRDVFHNMLVPV